MKDKICKICKCLTFSKIKKRKVMGKCVWDKLEGNKNK